MYNSQIHHERGTPQKRRCTPFLSWFAPCHFLPNRYGTIYTSAAPRVSSDLYRHPSTQPRCFEDVSWCKPFPDLYNGLAASRRTVSILCCTFTQVLTLKIWHLQVRQTAKQLLHWQLHSWTNRSCCCQRPFIAGLSRPCNTPVLNRIFLAQLFNGPQLELPGWKTH